MLESVVRNIKSCQERKERKPLHLKCTLVASLFKQDIGYNRLYKSKMPRALDKVQDPDQEINGFRVHARVHAYTFSMCQTIAAHDGTRRLDLPRLSMKSPRFSAALYASSSARAASICARSEYPYCWWRLSAILANASMLSRKSSFFSVFWVRHKERKKEIKGKQWIMTFSRYLAARTTARHPATVQQALPPISCRQCSYPAKEPYLETRGTRYTWTRCLGSSATFRSCRKRKVAAPDAAEADDDDGRRSFHCRCYRSGYYCCCYHRIADAWHAKADSSWNERQPRRGIAAEHIPAVATPECALDSSTACTLRGSEYRSPGKRTSLCVCVCVCHVSFGYKKKERTMRVS